MTDIVVNQAVTLVNRPDIELVAAGTWEASTGKATFTLDDLSAAVAAMDCPGVRNPVLKLGHDEEDSTGGVRWDGEPAVGWVENMRLDGTGSKIIGDYMGMPAWLADVLPSAYPDRSVEMYRPFVCQIGHRHPAVISAVALLGVNPPAVGVLRSLQAVKALYTASAVRDDALAIRVGDRVVQATLARQGDAERAAAPIYVAPSGPGRFVRLAYDPNQPRDNRGRWGSGSAGHSGWKGMTDDEFAERAELVKTAVGKARKTLATDKTHTNEIGAWTPERDRLHREIADDLYAKAKDVPNDGKAVIAGGLGGAGKTTVLTKHAGVDPDQFFTINPDDIKEEMARRGMVPAVPDAPDLSPMERSALIHEESSRIAAMLADRAYSERKNMIWDITMSSQSSVQSRIDALKKAGYDDIEGIFVDIPVETSVERAMSRYRRGVDKYMAGEGLGGRYVPPEIIRAQQTSSGKTINRQTFEGLRKQFTRESIYDNSVTGQPPRKVT